MIRGHEPELIIIFFFCKNIILEFPISELFQVERCLVINAEQQTKVSFTTPELSAQRYHVELTREKYKRYFTRELTIRSY